MNKKGLVLFLLLVIFVFLFSYARVSYAYLEPVRKVLPAGEVTELTNPDLPKRTGIKIGEIILHSDVSAGLQIDPNIYLSENSETYDVVTLGKALFGVEIPIQKNKISMDYEASEYHYNRFPVNDHVDQRVRGLIVVNLTDYRLTLRDTFRNYTSLPGSTNTSRLKQDSNEMRLGVTRETDKFGFDVGYSNLVHHYYSDDSIFGPLTYRDRNSVTHIADMTVAYRFWPKTSLVLENDYGFSEYKSSNSPDYYYDDLLIGVKGDLHKNLSTTLQVGSRYQYFRESPIMFDETFFGFIMRGGFKYAISEDDVLDLNLTRSTEDSTYQNLTYYMANFAGLEYTHVFTDKISGKITGTYQRNEYPTETTEGAKTAKRRDNAFGAGLSLRYDIRKWLSTEIGYEFKKERSNFRTFEYEDHITTFKVTAGF